MIHHTRYLVVKIFSHFLQKFFTYNLGFPVPYYIHVTLQQKFVRVRVRIRVYQKDEVAIYQAPEDGLFSDTQHEIGRFKGNAYYK